MKELDLIKVLMHKLAIIDKKLAILEDMNEHLFEQQESLKLLGNNLKELKNNMEVRHIENINSDDMLFRSILDKRAVQYK
jgi:hypothetical protein